MSLIKLKPHEEISAAFARQVPNFVSMPDSDGMRQAHSGDGPEPPTLEDLAPQGERIVPHDPQQVFVLTLKDAANNPGKALSPAGWRFFAGNQRGKMLMGTVSRRLPSEGWKMMGGFYGDRVWELFAASKALEELPEVQGEDFELRVLAVPGLNIEAFWLVAMAGRDADFVVPIPAGQYEQVPGLDGGPVYRMADFLAAIRPMALLRLTAKRHYGS